MEELATAILQKIIQHFCEWQTEHKSKIYYRKKGREQIKHHTGMQTPEHHFWEALSCSTYLGKVFIEDQPNFELVLKENGAN